MNTLLKETAKPSSPKRKQISLEGKKQHQQDEDIIMERNSSAQNPDVESAYEQQLMCHEQVTQQQLEECAEFLNKAKTLQYALEADLLTCDAKWTLFVAAAFSYRYDSVLQPFPPQFANEQLGYDIDSLMSVIKDTPKLSIILQNLMEQSYSEPSCEVIDLLYWVLIVMFEPDLRLVVGEELNSLLSSIDEKPVKVKPTHVFEVSSTVGFHSEATFYAKTAILPLKLAFMGTKLENYFSMLQNGFAQLVKNKTNLQLTTDLKTGLQYSPYCAAWGASECGSIISCTAICEFAINVEEDKIVANKNDKSCVDIQLSNTQDVRLRYLIFYGRRFPGSLLKKARIFSWLYSYKYSLSLISYVLFLVTIGIANSNSGEMVKFYVSRKIDYVLNFCRRLITKDVIR